MGTCVQYGLGGTVGGPTTFLDTVTMEPAADINVPAGETWVVQVGGTDELILSGANLTPGANDGNALGSATVSWADLFLASGGVVNWANGVVTLTEAATGLTFAGTGMNSFVITQAAGASGVPTLLTLTGAAHTGLTAATEDIGADLNFSATKTWASGAGPLATQREVLIQAPTYVGNAAGALTITQAATVAISGPPVQGANITLTATDALWVQAGRVRLDNHVHFNTGVAMVATDYSIGRDADATNQLHLNVPTGATFELSVNDTVEMTLSATAVDFQSNTITTTGGGSLTGTWSDLGSVTTVDINGGTLDGVSIGAASASTAIFTTLGINPSAAGSKTMTAGTQYTGSLAGNVQTTDATVTTLITITLDTDQAVTCQAIVSAVLSDGSKGFHAVIAYGARKDGAAAATEVLANAELAKANSDAAVFTAVAFAVSGDTVLLQVTGAAANTIKWTANVSYSIADI